jgi:mono/diheme cytochrome c family protein
MRAVSAFRPTLLAALGVLLPLSLTLVPANPAWAQDSASSAAVSAAASDAQPASTDPSPTNPLSADLVTADREVWKKADCSNCHGWSGNGHDTGPVPPGPSLRDTQLDYASIHQIVQCGIPSTRMPSHDRLAYVDDRCYGQKSADLGKAKPQKGTPLQPAEIDAIAAYVAGFLQGKPATTKAECEEYFGAGSPACGNYS